jgi:hypothetical protein
MSDQVLAPGCRVLIQGLVDAPLNNGKEGLLTGFDRRSQRCEFLSAPIIFSLLLSTFVQGGAFK